MRLSEDNISIAKRRLFISEPWDSNIVKPDQSSEPMLLSKMVYEVREKPREYVSSLLSQGRGNSKFYQWC